MSEEMKACPIRESPYGYASNQDEYTCPECSHVWKVEEGNEEVENVLIVKDVNGNILQDGDSVVVIKDLNVKGSSTPVKVGTKVKNIRLVEGDHNIDCKIKGFGAMGLKSIFVKKALFTCLSSTSPLKSKLQFKLYLI